MEVADDTPLVEIPPEAYDKAAEMRALMGSDLEERAIADLVVSFDAGSLEVQLATWTLLTWKEQEAWRQFRQIAHNARKP